MDINSLTYLIEIFQKDRLEAHTREFLSQELRFDGLILVFADLIGIFKVDLLNKLPDQVLVEISAELFRKLLSNRKNIIIV